MSNKPKDFDKIRTEMWIEKVLEKFPENADLYDYSNVVYINNHTPVVLLCKRCGASKEIRPCNHLNGQGCRECNTKASAERRKKTREQIVEGFKGIHKDLYDYTWFEYLGWDTKSKIVCKRCGKDFLQTPHNHLAGKGCPSCNRLVGYDKQRKTTKEFVEEAREKHSSRYDYSRVEYVNKDTPVDILCPEHGLFSQRPSHHLRGSGCPVCGGTSKMTTEEFVGKAKKLYDDRFDLSKVEYVNNKQEVDVVCRMCGHNFTVKPNNFLNGYNCPVCGDKRCTDMDTEIFIKKATRKHNGRYDYSKVEYTDSTTKVCITCPEHGDFWQRPNGHLYGEGCPSCSYHVSKPEQEIADLIKSWCPGLEAQRNVRGLIPDFTVTFKKELGGKKTVHNAELDLYIPERNLAIEYNGMYWHDKKAKGQYYHCHKRQACDAVGIRMFTIWEADWQDERKRPIIERYLKNALGARDSNERTVYARKCVIKPVPQDDYRVFMNAYHVQGYASAKEAKYGLYTKDTDELVACMSFKILKSKDQKDTPFVLWDMVRYATSCNVPGGRSKLFKFLQKEFHMDHVQSFLDRDYFTGVSYRPEDGWTLEEDDQVTLDVWHPKGGRMSRQAWWHAAIPATLRKLGLDPGLYDPDLTQNENAYNAGCQFFENSGNARFEWHSEEGKADPVYQEWLAKQKKVSK